MTPKTITRKEFLEQTAALAVLGASTGTLATLLTGCTTVRYVSGTESTTANAVTVPLAEFADGTFVVVRKGGKLSAPVYLCKHADGTFSALVMKCTHKGCEVRPAGDLLICPCHGSEFTNKGVVLSPPALENLLSFHTSVDAASVTIYIQDGGVQ
ncbi:MAG: Rieske (2Fe-2S) protein [Ignavibacteria bacterium]|jgi:cytochrome b6-f complex iron-sulfur subunit|nr:Rieske (2Fe-2S) protein [Ignavibacteria bacterium]